MPNAQENTIHFDGVYESQNRMRETDNHRSLKDTPTEKVPEYGMVHLTPILGGSGHGHGILGFWDIAQGRNRNMHWQKGL